jgi:excisionase family DNA binding protein
MAQEGDVLTTHAAAKLCRVTASTLIRWIEDGRLRAYRTAGGHRRIRRADLEEFCSRQGIPIDGRFPNENTRVLIVLEDGDAAERLRVAIRSLDVLLEVHLATDAFGAGHAIARYCPRLVLVDPAVLGAAGRDIGRRIKQDPTMRDTFVALLTRQGIASVQAATAAGADEVLQLGPGANGTHAQAVRRVVNQAFGRTHGGETTQW